MKILVIEDDKQIVDLIKTLIGISWPETNLISTHLGAKGIKLFCTESPDLIILDLGLPDMVGFDALKQIREFSDVPVIILTVREEEKDIVRGLALGADDYVVKPFKELELLARIKAATRRHRPAEVSLDIHCGPFHFGPVINDLYKGDKLINLTNTEGRIFLLLLKNAGKIVPYRQIADEVWGEYYPDIIGSLKVYIRRLRKKIEEDPNLPTVIVNRPGIGYTLAIKTEIARTYM